jgi:hypothetical protein
MWGSANGNKAQYRVPSMFIYKDRVAKEEGNAMRKVKILEMGNCKAERDWERGGACFGWCSGL